MCSPDWLRFVAWLVVGILVYTGYDFQHSRLATNEDQQEGAPPAVASAEH
jgi:C-terminus of AA_permease